MKNLKTVTCPRCKGYGYIRGQRVEGRHLNNYKHVEGGRCFACEGTKVLHMTEDGKLIREDNGVILHYSKTNGQYLGILNNNSKSKSKPSKHIIFEPVRTINKSTEERIEERENSIKRMVIKLCMETESVSNVFTPLMKLVTDRSKEYCELLSKKDKGELIGFSEITIPLLEDTAKILDKFKDHKNNNTKEFINRYRNYNTELIKSYKTNLDTFSFDYIVF